MVDYLCHGRLNKYLAYSGSLHQNCAIDSIYVRLSHLKFSQIGNQPKIHKYCPMSPSSHAIVSALQEQEHLVGFKNLLAYP